MNVCKGRRVGDEGIDGEGRACDGVGRVCRFEASFHAERIRCERGQE